MGLDVLEVRGRSSNMEHPRVFSKRWQISSGKALYLMPDAMPSSFTIRSATLADWTRSINTEVQTPIGNVVDAC